MMQRYLVEVPHDPNPAACVRVIRIFLNTGSHYLARADWGCKDGQHSAWMIVEAASSDEARQIVPPQLRGQARVVQLNQFTVDDLDSMVREHDPSAP